MRAVGWVLAALTVASLAATIALCRAARGDQQNTNTPQPPTA